MLRSLKQFFTTPLTKRLLVLSIILHILVVLFISGNSRHSSISDKKNPPLPYITIIEPTPAALSTAIEDHSILFDTTPIVLPTLWNYNKSLQNEKTPIETPFYPFDPIITICKENILASFADPSNTSPQSLLEPDYWNFLKYFLKPNEKISSIDGRAAFAKILNLQTGKVEKTIKLAKPNLQEPLVERVEFLILISSTGQHGNPLRLNTTGVDEIDTETLKILQDSAFTWDLEPGYYKVLLGP